MRQLSFLVATILAFFIMVSFFLMSQTSSIRAQSILVDSNDLASQAAGVGLDLLEADGTVRVTPALTQGQVIMPHLNNETIKYVAAWFLETKHVAL